MNPPSSASDRKNRFFIDHGTIHDLVTGKHVRTVPEDGYEDGIEKCCVLLNGLDAIAEAAAAYRDCTHKHRASYYQALVEALHAAGYERPSEDE